MLADIVNINHVFNWCMLEVIDELTNWPVLPRWFVLPHTEQWSPLNWIEFKLSFDDFMPRGLIDLPLTNHLNMFSTPILQNGPLLNSSISYSLTHYAMISQKWLSKVSKTTGVFINHINSDWYRVIKKSFGKLKPLVSCGLLHYV